MDDVTAAILAVVVAAASVSAVIATVDKRGLRRPPKAPKTFNTRAFETALCTPGTGWFHDKLRCNKKSFQRMLLVHAAWGREPGTNTKNPVIKRVALTMLYLVKGGTMDQAATALGISRPRSVAYINKTQDVLSAMAKSMIFMPPAEELAAVEDGFYATAGFPDTIGAETSSIGPQGKTCEETRVQFADWQVWWHRMETACDQSDEASGSLHLDSSRHTEHVLHLNKGLNALLEGHKSTVATVSDLMLVLCHTNNRAALREHTDLSPLRRAGAPCSTCSLAVHRRIEALLADLRVFNNVTIKLQRDISRGRARIVELYSSALPVVEAST
ncbi:hypothetical protein F441_20357 [Phytophthora nicotianae CJ01A1]|uniref:DDE Tnp4 domain-containing protein n=1 Tax=Phytophthora nicotianae CJ01A1 TaxID=1317063 RepID=W2VWN7_PHYNI|nr:hypothetical protein F441_20357 [Phytophthora nicotianae CJ01A1]